MTLQEKLNLPYTKLDLSCGLNFFEREDEHWIRMDGSSANGIEVVCDWKDLLKHIPQESIDLVHTSDTMEHIPLFEAGEIMRNWNGIMKIGGHLFGTTPNLSYVIKSAYEKTEPFDWVIRNLYGDQSEYMSQHYNLFTKDTLKLFLDKYGFGEVIFNSAWGEDDRDWGWLSFKCTKIKNI